MSEINIEAGPIDRLSLKIDGPGVYLMRAENGAGKSIALSAVKTLITGEGKLPIGYGKEEAKITGFGVTVSFGRTKRGVSKFGELEVQSLEGSYSLGNFVKPANKDPLVSDAKSIKELLKISGYKVGREVFSGLFMSEKEFNEVVQIDSISDDPVEMSSRIKRDIEEAARHYEAVFAKSKADGQVLFDSVPKEMTESEIESPEEAEKALEFARRNLLVLSSRRSNGLGVIRNREDVEKKLLGLAPTDAEHIIVEGQFLRGEVDQLKAAVIQSQEHLAILNHRLSVASEKLEAKRIEMVEAQNKNKAIAELRKTLDSALPEVPSEEDIAAAGKEMESLVRRLDASRQKESLMEKATKARELFFKAEEASLVAARYRESAAGVEKILADMVSGCGADMIVRSGRLVVNTKRGEEFFSDLSEGQRCRIGIKLLVDSMKRRFPDDIPVCVLEQEAWEPLQPSVKSEIREIAKQEGVAIIAAEASDDPEIVVEAP